MAPRPEPRAYPPRAAEIVAAARDLLEAEGADALTMRRLADALGIRAASLYKHLPNKQAVEVAMADTAFFDLGARMHAAVDAAPPGRAVEGLLAAYRQLARAQPNLYRLATSGFFPREWLTPGLEDWAGEPFFRVTGDPYVAQALWAAAHGAAILELDGRFLPGSELDRTWAALVAAFTG